MWRTLSQIAEYLADAILLSVFGVVRIAKAALHRGDVYDAKVILASDISDLGGHRLAAHWLGRLIASQPNRPRAYFERGMVHLELHDNGSAQRDFERCLQIDPTFPGAKDWHARAQQ
jgi:hypothetical protein